jgi:CDP-2,3-bis-(O-geranylgeranyl)-sn-glycerol synthase
VGLLTASIQMLISASFSWPESYSMGLDYGSYAILIMGLFMGFGALIGDSIKSFFKRQMNIAPGRPWVPFDQLDFVIGGAIASLPFIVLPLNLYILGLFIALVLHPTFNVLAWLLRLQDKPF